MRRFYDKEKNTKERARALAKIYIDKKMSKGFYSCSRLHVLSCDGQLCTDCDFSKTAMEDNYNRVMKVRKVGKIDKTYKLKLKRMRGYNG